jgi:hypothetical protein
MERPKPCPPIARCAALGVHVVIGYLDFAHLAPAYAGLLLFLVGFAFCAHAYSRAAKGQSGAATAC